MTDVPEPAEPDATPRLIAEPADGVPRVTDTPAGLEACAAALAMRFWAGEPDGADRWTVDVPGGRLEVTVRGDEVELAGPAVLVADGTSPLVTG